MGGLTDATVQYGTMDDNGDKLSSEELEMVVNNWIELEDDPVIIEAEIEEALEALEKQKEQGSGGGNNDGDDGDDDGIDIEGSVDDGGFTDFFELEASIEAAKSFVAREGYPKLVSDLFSSAVHNMRIHRSKKARQDATLHRYGF